MEWQRKRNWGEKQRLCPCVPPVAPTSSKPCAIYILLAITRYSRSGVPISQGEDNTLSLGKASFCGSTAVKSFPKALRCNDRQKTPKNKPKQISLLFVRERTVYGGGSCNSCMNISVNDMEKVKSEWLWSISQNKNWNHQATDLKKKKKNISPKCPIKLQTLAPIGSCMGQNGAYPSLISKSSGLNPSYSTEILKALIAWIWMVLYFPFSHISPSYQIPVSARRKTFGQRSNDSCFVQNLDW